MFGKPLRACIAFDAPGVGTAVDSQSAAGDKVKGIVDACRQLRRIFGERTDLPLRRVTSHEMCRAMRQLIRSRSRHPPSYVLPTTLLTLGIRMLQATPCNRGHGRGFATKTGC